MDDQELFFKYGLSLLLGVLVGIQREHALKTQEGELPAGIRTFGLMGVMGCGAAMLSSLMLSPLPFVSLILVCGAYFTVSYYHDYKNGRVGLTTKICAMIVILLGGLIFYEFYNLGAGVAVALTLLLSAKFELHSFAKKISNEDIYATLKFAVITTIILPLLPDHTFGSAPFDIFNPKKIWYLVVLISAISFVGYILMKLIGARKGIGLTGILGGVISSTALTLTFTQRSREYEHLSNAFAFSIMIAWTIMFIRIWIIAWILNPALAYLLLTPFTFGMGFGLIYSFILMYFSRKQEIGTQDVKLHNPFELWPAIKFTLLFIFLLFCAKSAHQYFGNSGVYLSSFFGGFMDVDAILLSMLKLIQSSQPNPLPMNIAVFSVIIAVISNTLLKGGVAITAGAPSLRKALLPGFLGMLGVCLGASYFLIA